MNSRLYRVIFNKNLGRLVVVSEKATAQGKAGSQGGSDSSAQLGTSQTIIGLVQSVYGKFNQISASVLLGLGIASISSISHAGGIIADANAPKHQQATVLSTANGLPQVNIQTPSAAGVSRNTFSQFDVDIKGAILNNSRTNTQSQTAGWIEGNPWLAKGEARVILNEVNSSNPSQLAGFTEIAGKKAELIIANPAGITCSGCGFINANRTTLTTGTPNFNNGNLTGFSVNGGHVQVDGQGISDNSDYTQIISQTAKINANVHAKQLDVIVGDNEVSYATDPSTTQINAHPTSNVNQSTGVALDISNLGGMYAGKIRLIGTGKGMGVTNAGTLAASEGLSLDSQGNLTNSGSLTGVQGVHVNTHGNRIDNSGSITSAGNASTTGDIGLDSQSLNNTGYISSHGQTQLNQTDISNSGTISAGQVSLNAASLTNSGAIEQTGSGKLGINAQNLTNQNQAVIGQTLYDDQPVATTPTAATAPTTASNGSQTQVIDPTAASAPNQPSEQPIAITADGGIHVTNLTNTGPNASIKSNGQIDIIANHTQNLDKSSIAVNSLNPSSNSSDNQVSNRNSRMQLTDAQWQLTQFDNSQGQLISNKGIHITSQNPISNQGGVLATLGDVELTTPSGINNQGGTIQGSNTHLAGTDINNSQGHISAQGALTLDSNGTLTNTGGGIDASGDIQLTAGGFNNDTGLVHSGGKLNSHSQTLNNNGQLYGTSGTAIDSQTINNTGLIASLGNTDIHGNSIDNTGTLAAGINPDSSVANNQSDLTVVADSRLTSHGTHIATGQALLSSPNTDLTGSKTQARDINLASQGDLNLQGTTITATNALNLTAQGTINNQQGDLSGNVLHLTANRLDNTEGKLTQAGNSDLTLAMAGGIDNTRGHIASNSQNLTLTTSDLINSEGQIIHAGSGNLDLTANQVNNHQGSLLSQGSQNWQITGDIDNSHGVIQGSDYHVAAQNLNNREGQIAAIASTSGSTPSSTNGSHSDITTQGNIDNSAGVIASNTGSLTLTTQRLDNSQGSLVTLTDLGLTSHDLINSGSVYAGGNTLIHNTASLTNTGSIAAAGDVSVTTGNLTQSNTGQLIAGLNPDNSLSTAAKNLTVTSSGEQQNAGFNSATGNIDFTGTQLNLNNSHNQANNVRYTANTGDINHTDATTQASGQLSAHSNGTLINDVTGDNSQQDKGVLQADSFDFAVGGLSNHAGTIYQTGTADFNLNTGNINNTQGHIGGNATNTHITGTLINNSEGSIAQTGTGTTQINANTLTNDNGAIVSQGELMTGVTGKLSNHDGSVQGTGLTATAGEIDNNNGQFISTAGDIHLTAQQLTNAGDKAIVQSAANLTTDITTLNNTDKATLYANGAANVHANTLTNQNAAVIASNDLLTITGDTLTNSASLLSNKDSTHIAVATLNNQAGGFIQGEKDLSMTADTLHNQGTLLSKQSTTLQGGLFDNKQGTLSGSNVTLNSATIDNSSGLINQSDTAGNLAITNQGQLINQGTLANNTGIVSAGNAQIQTGALDNQQGNIGANNLTVNVTGSQSLNNGAGQLVANDQLSLTASHATDLNNQAGKIQAKSVTVTVGDTQAGRIDNNAAGSLISGDSVAVTTGTLNNQNTQQAAADTLSQGIVAAQDLAIHSQTVNNQTGQLVAGSQLNLTADGQLNNQAGRIEAPTLVIKDGQDTARVLQVNNDGGTINAQSASIESQGLSNTGGSLSVNTLGIDVTGDLTYGKDDHINADALSIKAGGTLTNQGALQGTTSLTVNASNIDNQQDASMVAKHTTLTASNNITNQGLINSGSDDDDSETFITAGGSVSNSGQGRIYGDHVAIKANTLNNTPEGHGTPAPVIAARQRLDIGVTTLNNNPSPDRMGRFNSDFNGQAQLLSNGELHIGGDLDDKHQAIGKAGVVTNRGATIESLGDMHIAADTLNNQNADFSTKFEDIQPAGHVTQYVPDTAHSIVVTPDQVSFYTHEDNSDIQDLVIPSRNSVDIDYFKVDADEHLVGEKTQHSDPSRIISGGDMQFDLDNFNTNKSQIIAGGTISVKGNAGNVDAEASTVTPKYNYSNITETHFYRGIEDWHIATKSETHAAPGIYNPKTVGTPYELKILQLDIPGVGVYDTAVTIQNQNKTQQADITAAAINKFSSAVATLKALSKATIGAQAKPGMESNNKTSDPQEIAAILQKFSQTQGSQLNDSQKQQLADVLAAQKAGKPVDPAVLDNLIASLNQSIKQLDVQQTRTINNPTSLPNSSLYNINPAGKNYLIATDPAFAGYKNWLSSDYMMQRLGLDQNNMHKRMGDGYYEQRLIRDQVMALTGKRYLGDYRSDDAMYQALMENGVASAAALNLRPGIALTADQTAQLTTDIVWLVEQSVTLPDGSTQTALIPKVYTRNKVSDIRGDGSLVAAKNVDMQLTGDLDNHGSIVAHNSLAIAANNINNKNGGLLQGNFVQLNTVKDLNNIAASIKAGSALDAKVGGNFNNITTTYTTNSQKGKSSSTRIGIDQVASVFVGDGLKGMTDANGKPYTTLNIDVKGDTTFGAGQLINQGGSSRLVTQGNVNLNAVNTGYQINAIGDSNNYNKSGKTQDIGSVIASSGDTYIKGNNVSGTAATIQSGGITAISADNDVTFKEGRATENLSTASKTTDKGFLSNKTTQDRHDMTSDQAIGSHIDGDKVYITGKNNVHLTDTEVISDHGTAVKAGNNLTVDAAENRYSESSSHDEKKSGLFGNGGLSFTLGSQKNQNQNSTTQVWHSGSTIGANDGNVVLTAGNHYQQTGSIVAAGNESNNNVHDLTHGTVIINAKSATVENTTATTENHAAQKHNTSGLTVSVSNSLVDQVNGIKGLAKAGETTNSDQMKVMAGVAGVAKARTLNKDLQAAADTNLYNNKNEVVGQKNTEQTLKGIGNTRIQATIGSQSSKNNQDSLTGKNEASQINANNLVLNIQGAGKDSDFVLTGSDINLKGDRYNNVEGDVIEQAATGQGYEHSSNKSQGFGIGVYADTKGSAGITANANMAKGLGNGEITTNANSHVNVAGTTYQNVGGDYILDGAVEKGDYMTGHIAGGIHATSRQDTATYKGKQTNVGISTDIDLKGAGSSVSVSGGRNKANADYAAVVEQTGMQYRKSDVVVDGKSTFKGAYLTTATPEDNQTQFKNGVEVSDIQNHAKYDASGISVGVSMSADPTSTAKNIIMNGPKISGIGYGKDGDSKTSTTYGAVTGVAGKSDVTTANVGSLNEVLQNNFDKDKVNEQIGAQVQVSQAFDTERRAYRGEMAQKEQKMRKDAKDAQEQGNEAKARELTAKADKQQHDMVLFDSITGAIYGPNANGATGYVARAVAPQVSYQIGQYFKEIAANNPNGKLTNVQESDHILAHGILAAAVSAATGSDLTTGALSAMGAEAAAKPLARFLFKTDDPSKLTVEQKETLSSITSLAGLGLGASTGNVANAVNATETAKVAVEDNYLTGAEINQWLNEKAECIDNNSVKSCTWVDTKWVKYSESQNQKLKSLCKSYTAECQRIHKELMSLPSDPFSSFASLGEDNSLMLATERVRSHNLKASSDLTIAREAQKAGLDYATSVGMGAFYDKNSPLKVLGKDSSIDIENNRAELRKLKGYPNYEETQALIAEHSQTNTSKLTPLGAQAIYDNTILKGTTGKVAGANAKGPDINIHSNTTKRVINTVQVKSVESLGGFESEVKNDLRKDLGPEGGSKIIAVQVPAGSDTANIARLSGKLRNNFNNYNLTGRRILVVDSKGHVLIPLQPFRNFVNK